MRAGRRPATGSHACSPSGRSRIRASASPRASGCAPLASTANGASASSRAAARRSARDAARDRRSRRALERTTNPPGAVGEGIAAAYRAGAALADLEFVQFHPTALVDSSLLLSEALRGEGALLLDERGERFTDELAPRDVVAREIAARGTALLDLRAIDRARFPTLMGSRSSSGLRPGRDADPGRAGRALHRRRDRHRPRRPLRAARASTRRASARPPASMARTGSRRTRCSSASSSAAAPRSRRSASPAFRATSVRSRGAPLRDGDAGPPPRALARLRPRPRRRAASSGCATRRTCSRGSSPRARSPGEESRGSHFRVDFPPESDRFERHVVLRPGCRAGLETWL